VTESNGVKAAWIDCNHEFSPRERERGSGGTWGEWEWGTWGEWGDVENLHIDPLASCFLLLASCFLLLPSIF